MAPETTLENVLATIREISTPMPDGPFKPSWVSLEQNYRIPSWFIGAKFGLFMHWGVYAVPAHHNEWYEKHMYGNAQIMEWHQRNFGAQDRFGYKDFIPMFTQEKFNPDEWAALFKVSGARFIIPTAQHHDNFAMWDSKVTPYNAKRMGPRRDLIGELEQAVRRQGLKFGLSNHGIENFQFINPPDELLEKMKAQKTDLFDPEWSAFYQVADRSNEACRTFLLNWYARNVELIEKYKPDMMWFDNGIDQRYLDPLKLQIAAYYYNRAGQWGKEVSISSKKAAFAPTGTNIKTIGSILDFEGHIPPGIRTGVWQVDSKIGSTWGYTSDMTVSSAASVISTLVDIVSKNGTLLLNLSPKADGTIPEAQQQTLREVGQWLSINGEAIYDTHNWIRFGEEGSTQKIRFTVKGDVLYAIILGKWPGSTVTIPSLAIDKAPRGVIRSVTMPGNQGVLTWSHDDKGLNINLPAKPPCEHAYVIKISGLTMNAPSWTTTGNPILD
jgi:alpha-L-fucosidase